MSNSDRIYIARADSNEMVESKDGNPYVIVDFVIEEGERNGEILKWMGFFTEKTATRTIESLRVCGWKGDDVSSLDGLSDNLVQITAGFETYNDKEYERVRWVNAIGSSAVKKVMSSEQRKEFAQKLRGAVLAYDKSVKENPVAKPSNNDDDLPF